MTEPRFIPVDPCAAFLLSEHLREKSIRAFADYESAHSAIEDAKRLSVAAFVVADDAKNMARIANRIQKGGCSYHSGNTEPRRSWFHLCPNRAKRECPNCGGPFCGSHDYAPRSKARPRFTRPRV